MYRWGDSKFIDFFGNEAKFGHAVNLWVGTRIMLKQTALDGEMIAVDRRLKVNFSSADFINVVTESVMSIVDYLCYHPESILFSYCISFGRFDWRLITKGYGKYTQFSTSV